MSFEFFVLNYPLNSLSNTCVILPFRSIGLLPNISVPVHIHTISPNYLFALFAFFSFYCCSSVVNDLTGTSWPKISVGKSHFQWFTPRDFLSKMWPLSAFICFFSTKKKSFSLLWLTLIFVFELISTRNKRKLASTSALLFREMFSSLSAVCSSGCASSVRYMHWLQWPNPSWMYGRPFSVTWAYGGIKSPIGIMRRYNPRVCSAVRCISGSTCWFSRSASVFVRTECILAVDVRRCAIVPVSSRTDLFSVGDWRCIVRRREFGRVWLVPLDVVGSFMYGRWPTDNSPRRVRAGNSPASLSSLFDACSWSIS